MLGIIAGSGRLPIPVEAFEAAIRADGKGVDGNLRGFRAGLDAAQKPEVSKTRSDAKHAAHAPAARRASSGDADIEKFPEAARDIIREGVRRLIDYQSEAYARLYLDRLAADPRRRHARQCRRPPHPRDRAASRGAHVLRGRDPRRAGEDRSGALRAHRRRKSAPSPASR